MKKGVIILAVVLLLYFVICLGSQDQIRLDIDKVGMLVDLSHSKFWILFYAPFGENLGYRSLFYMQQIFNGIFIMFCFFSSTRLFKKRFFQLFFTLMIASSQFILIELNGIGRGALGLLFLGMLLYFYLAWRDNPRKIFLLLMLFSSLLLTTTWPLYIPLLIVPALIFLINFRKLNKKDFIIILVFFAIILAFLLSWGFFNISEIGVALKNIWANESSGRPIHYYFSKTFTTFTSIDTPITHFLQESGTYALNGLRTFFSTIQLLLVAIGFIYFFKKREWVLLAWVLHLGPVLAILGMGISRYTVAAFPIHFLLVTSGLVYLQEKSKKIPAVAIGSILVIFSILFSFFLIQTSEDLQITFFEKDDGETFIRQTYGFVEDYAVEGVAFHELSKNLRISDFLIKSRKHDLGILKDQSEIIKHVYKVGSWAVYPGGAKLYEISYEEEVVINISGNMTRLPWWGPVEEISFFAPLYPIFLCPTSGIWEDNNYTISVEGESQSTNVISCTLLNVTSGDLVNVRFDQPRGLEIFLYPGPLPGMEDHYVKFRKI